MDFKKNNLNKIFYTFIALHVLLFSLVALFRLILPLDSMEAIEWGALLDFGTNKHPPLSGWIVYFVYNIFKSDYAVYLLSQLFIAFGFIYVHKCAKLFLDKTKAVLATLIIMAGFIYSFITAYEGFDPNIILMAFLPAVTYYFYKSINYNSTKDWLLLAVFSALSFLGKYQSVMLFVPLFLYLIIEKNARKTFKNPKLYICASLAFLIVLPHIIWLFKTDFFSCQYFIHCEQKYEDFIQGGMKYIISPLKFIFEQFIAILSILFIFFSAKLIFDRPVSFRKNCSSDCLFLLCAGVFPLLFQALPGLFNGAALMSSWGYELLFMTGILLFYFIPFELNKKAITYILSFILFAMITIFIVLSIVFATERTATNRFPIKYITNILKEDFKNQTKTPLKYLAGYDRYTILLTLPQNNLLADMECWGEKNPWLNYETLEKNGFIIYENIYSSWSQTVPSLQRALTEQSQYNEKEFEKSVSIIDVA